MRITDLDGAGDPLFVRAPSWLESHASRSRAGDPHGAAQEACCEQARRGEELSQAEETRGREVAGGREVTRGREVAGGREVADGREVTRDCEAACSREAPRCR